MHAELRPAVKYAKDVADGVTPAGQWARRACSRFVADLAAAESSRSPWAFDEERARAPIMFAALMVNIKGPEADHPIVLLPYERWVLANLFGFVDRKTGRRRFRQASVWVPKGNGKTTLAAVLGLCVTFTEGEGGAEGYSAAVSYTQASIAFDMARRMAEKTPDFRERFGVNVNVYAVSQPRTASSFKALSSNTKALDGLNVHFAVLDEIGSHKSTAIYDALITATGKRAEPLLISISTATDNTTGVGRQVWNYTQAVLAGLIRDDRFFGVIYDADAEDDPWTEATWRKANPGWGRLVQPEALRAMAQQALASPALQAAFKTRHLNIWVAANAALFDIRMWEKCADPTLKLEDFKGKPCIAGLDMATRTDFAAGVLLFPQDEDDGKRSYALFCNAWLPEAAVDAGRNPLWVQWAQDGALTVTEGEVTDYDAIEGWLDQAAHDFELKECGYDPFDLTQLSQRLRNQGFPMHEYRPSTLNFSEPTKLLDALMREGRIRHNGDPVLTWCMGNVVGHYDARSNVYPRKESEEKKIDAAVATIIALGVSIAAEKDGGGYIYTDTDLLVF